MATILDKIVATKREEVAAAKLRTPPPMVMEQAHRREPPRDFFAAVTAGSGSIRLIAEIKKASPSAGLIRSDFDPVAIARAYEAAGAHALSVLTDAPYFQGAAEYIARVKEVVGLPVLRKDFIIDEYQVFESRALDADAILLIAAILPPGRIESLSRIAADLGMAALVEIHDGREWDAVRPLFELPSRGRAEAGGAPSCDVARRLLGINNRDLHRQVTDLDTTVRLSRRLAPGVRFVSESGIQSSEDVLRLRAAGAAAVLIGESFMRSADIAAAVGSMFPAGLSLREG